MLAHLTFTRGNVQAASAVLQATARQLSLRGQDLWPPESLTVPRLLKHYPQESWWVAWQDEQAVGTYCLLETDPFFWPDDPPGQALYLHKLGVHPQAQGAGLAQELLRHAVQQTEAAERPYLRLDTGVERLKLRELYTRFGFQTVDERKVGLYQVVRLQLQV